MCIRDRNTVLDLRLPNDVVEVEMINELNEENVKVDVRISMKKANVMSVSYTHLDVYKRQNLALQSVNYFKEKLSGGNYDISKNTNFIYASSFCI